MKGNKKILAIAILLLLIAVSYGTYAIYKSSVSGTAQATAAKWAIAFKSGATTYTSTMNITFDGSECTNNNNHVATGFIAPGVTCTKNVEIDATGTQVDVAYSLTTTGALTVNGTTKPENSNAITATIGSSDGQILMSDTPQSDIVPVTITWGGLEGDSYDPGDTTIGEGSWVISVPITLTAKQMMS